MFFLLRPGARDGKRVSRLGLEPLRRLSPTLFAASAHRASRRRAPDAAIKGISCPRAQSPRRRSCVTISVVMRRSSMSLAIISRRSRASAASSDTSGSSSSSRSGLTASARASATRRARPSESSRGKCDACSASPSSSRSAAMSSSRACGAAMRILSMTLRQGSNRGSWKTMPSRPCSGRTIVPT